MSDSKFNYDFASTGAFSGVVDPAEVGSNFPAQTFTHHLFDASLHWFLTDDLGIRLFYRFEREDLDDFHYDGLTDPVVNDVVYLVAVPENFDVNIFGVLLEKSF